MNYWKSRWAGAAIAWLALTCIMTACGTSSAANESLTSAMAEENGAVSGTASDATGNKLSGDPVASSSGDGQSDSENSQTAARSSDLTSASRDIFAMDTYMTVKACGANADQAVDDAENEINRLDKLLSTGSDTSEVSDINRNGGGSLSSDGQYLMKTSLALYRSTNGLFDVSIYPVMELWGFPTKEYKVPDADELAATLKLVDASKIAYDETTGKVSFAQKGMEIDFGGIAKGYTSSRVMEIFRKDGVTSGLANLGGNVQALGTKPDGSNWRIAIRDPNDESKYLGVLSIADRAVITSGGYERYFKKDGKTYHHIIDPRTGYPAESGIKSATVVSSDGTMADGLSTSLFIMGVDTAEKYWRAHSDEFDMILMDDDNQLYVTEEIADDFTGNYDVTVVKKGDS